MPVKFYYKPLTRPRRAPTASFKCDLHFHSVWKKLSLFFQDQKFCDVVLIAGIDGTQVKTHKMMLAASSDYFFAMFGGNLSESHADEVVLDQVDGVTLRMLVNFMYTSTIEIRSNNVENILTAANLFQMKTIVEQCCKFMIKQLDVSNCLGIALYAEQHNHQKLYENAYAMVCERFTELHNEDEFNMLDVDQICKFLSSDDICVSSEEDVFRSLLAWVKHDKSNREKALPRLLSHLRFSLLRPSSVKNEIRMLIKSNEYKETINSIINEPARPRNPKRKIYYISAWFNNANNLGVEAYSPILKKWAYQEWKAQPNNRSVFTGAILDNKLIIAGGREENFISSNVVESLDFKTLKWAVLPPMNTRRELFAMVTLNGKLYATGGRDENGGLESVERYDPLTGRWEYVAPMWEKHFDHSAVAMDGLLYVIGGSYSFECYDPQTNHWTRKATMKLAAAPTGAAVVNNRLYAASIDGNMLQRYDPINNSWEEIVSLGVSPEYMQCPQSYMQCCTVGDNLIIKWGNLVNQFNTVTQKWTTLPQFEKLYGKGILLSM